MPERSKLILLKLRNLGCIGPEGIEIALDNIVCLVGRNNAGKSTVIRAYELALGSRDFTENDRCQWTPEDDFPEVELWVHIPEGIPNVDAKWKQDKDGLKIVRSRWQWRGLQKIRQTWDPEADNGAGNWAEDGKAGGADNVFNSRLPQPLRVDSLQDAFAEHDELLKLVTDPAIKTLKQLQNSADSPLRKAMEQFVTAAMDPINQYQETINEVGTKVHESLMNIFPELGIHIRVAMEPPTVDPAKALLAGSSIRFQEETADTGIKQQGTGTRRALFWTLLQVRNEIVRAQKAEAEKLKAVARLQSELEKEQKKQKPNQEKIEGIVKKIQASTDDNENTADDYALPGYILLIDEPENCLHPMAIRAARSHLYALAEDPDWQIMLSTHSPYFIDPLADHTTIVRLERQGKQTSPRTYRTATMEFSIEDRENLRALLQLDSSLAEMFFGSYPVVVEGDTELAAFIASIIEQQEQLSAQVALIPARGKALIVPLIKLLTHFQIPFGVLHDADSPLRGDGKANSAWTINSTIADAIIAARKQGIVVRHRISVPDFERAIDTEEGSKDKPILAYRRVRKDAKSKQYVRDLYHGLFDSKQNQPTTGLADNATREEIMTETRALVETWAKVHASDDPRFKFA